VTLLNSHVASAAQATVLTTELGQPFGYGRIIRSGERIIGIVEEKDASTEQREITEINSGMYAFDGDALHGAITGLNNNKFAR